MTPFVGLLFVVTASFGWSGLDQLRKVLVAKVSSFALLFYLTAGMVPLYAVWVALDGRTDLPPAYWLPALASVALNIIANLAFFESVRRSPLSVTIPLLSFTPVFATLLAIVLVGEIPSLLQGLGIALVVGGALSLQLGSGRLSLARTARALLREKGVLFMLLTALCWSATNSFDKVAAGIAGEPLHALFLSAAIGSVCLGILTLRGRLGELRAAARVPGTLAAALVVGAGALGLQLLSYQAVAVGVVETLKRGIGNALAVAWGRIFFGEAITAGKVTGVLLMAIGVALVISG